MKKNTLKDTLKEIDEISKLLKESYVFEDEPQIAPEEGMPMDDEMSPEEQQMMGEPNVLATNETLNKIRMLALDGIQQYANDVESEEYQVMKKIWLLCDKAYESEDKEK